MQYQWHYLIIINALGIILMHLDKRRAQRNRMRIPELMLFAVALFGGSIGILTGMFLFRHKTKHLHFLIVVPALLASQLILYILGGDFK